LTGPRFDHVVIVVDDIAAAKEFFTELGLEPEGEARLSGEWMDRINALEDVRVEIATLRAPDGSGRVELTRFDNPPVPRAEPDSPNTMGLRSVMFEVDDLDDAVARLTVRGGTLIGEIVTYANEYRLCYMRGPGGAIVALAQAIA
jgi:catechol 2,3-dioxygenase-like lactoylglutathione lyase family enzyme